MRTVVALLAVLLLAPPSVLGQAKAPVKLRAGMVTGIDQIGLPIAVERGFFEKWGLDVTIVRPYPTGVDAVNGLQAGETELVQVGVPMIGAVARGMDLVALGNYSGSATKRGSDATMAVVAREGSGVARGNLQSLKGKKIAVSFGTINHLYILAILEKAGLAPSDVALVNAPPPDMPGALLRRGIDAFSGWDPWPILALKDVPGAIELQRGGDLISYLGFNVGLRPWVEKNGETIESFLAALAEADRWMRASPRLAAQVATRWISGLRADVAEAAMQYNVQQADRRLSANSYRALWSAEERFHRLGLIRSTFDVNRHIEPRHVLAVMQKHPELFSDLPPIPARVAIKPGFVFKP